MSPADAGDPLADPAPALLETSGIVFAYPGRPRVLDGASLALAAGERLCLTGPNGAGKSTLLQIVVGLLVPQAGTVTAFGRARREEADFHEVRCLAGLVFQDPDDQLFCPTVAEDVAFGPLNMGRSRAEAAAMVERVLAKLGLAHLRDRVTHKLSGGEKRLVTLAAVLAMEPRVLLLDEPTNGLDEPTAARVTDILIGLPQAMIVVSHDPHFRKKIATRTVRLGDGRIVPEFSA
ncbi:ATPase component NikO of energizing module of nickel ECF transporter [Rhodovulum sp. PH10]|uniref:energy-coupling factor ABC transporter ATP-binding protein n=1 Tax=Rhodovulum sp. PH10 TaxID=1187851 RepID=UPI00027C22CA|nr:ABC transporter ATP-binding protein [Rhodovulum sp. PH10]EJW09301.1 ATPase component NikO of energizing module of nickel ECF transporter [Rhodovulum sp. PH10]